MKTLADEFELLEPRQKTQKAFDDAAKEPIVGEVKLLPWTCARHGVAIQMGSELVQAIGPDVKAFLSGGNYPNRYRDAVIVLWLSSLDREEVKNLCALPKPEFRMIDAYEWAEQVGATFGSELFFDGLKLLDRIVRNILASVFTVEDSDSTADKKKDIDPPGKSNTPLEPSEPVDTTPTTSGTTCLSSTLSNGAPCGLLPAGKTQSTWWSRVVSAIGRLLRSLKG